MASQDDQAASQPSAAPSSDATLSSSPVPDAAKAATAAPTNPRLKAMQAKHATLSATLADLQSQRDAMVAKATLPSGLAMPADWTAEQRTKQAMSDANATIKEHIALLHKYNEIKDIGQGLMGLLAEQRGVRVSEIMTDFGMSEKD